MKRRVDTIDEFVKKSNSQDIDEKSTSIAQQRLFGMAWAVRKGTMKRDDVPESVLKIADSDMSDEEMKNFAKTSHTGLPVHKTNEEDVYEYSKSVDELKTILDDMDDSKAIKEFWSWLRQNRLDFNDFKDIVDYFIEKRKK